MPSDDLAGTGIEAAVRAAGSQEALAELLGVTQQAVSSWVKRGWPPDERIVEISALTGIAPELLVKPTIAEALKKPFEE